jgi:hypothetical protein
VILVWNWPPCFPGPKCETQIDGYKVWGFDDSAGSAGAFSQIDTIANPGLTMAPLNWAGPKEPGRRRCYWVIAYKGTQGSEYSNLLCVTADEFFQFSRTFSQAPSAVSGPGITEGYAINCQGYSDGVIAPVTFNSGPNTSLIGNEILVGHDIGEVDPGTCASRGDIYEGGVFFDLSQIPPQTRVLHANVSYSIEGPAGNSCLEVLKVASADWRNATAQNPTLITSDEVIIPDPSNRFNVDLTNVVQAWVNGSHPNFGLDFSGGDENIYPDDTMAGQCTTLYNSFVLSVTVATSP